MAFPGDGWHPRWTPYRFFVLSTTLSLGTAKAVATQQGSSVLPTTLEWISGVVLFIAFFVTSKYDSGEATPPYFAWIFELDCMNYVWDFCYRFGVRRPFYTSRERDSLEYEKVPPITLYRIMVSFSVIFFGMSKATLSYFGRSNSANWIDWFLGTLISSIFYCLGLYENNSANLYPWFFVTDRSEYLHPTSKGLIYTVCTLFLAVFVWVCIYGLLKIVNDDAPRYYSSSTPSLFATLHDRITDIGLWIMFLIVILYCCGAFFMMTALMWGDDDIMRIRGRRGIMHHACMSIFSYLSFALRSLVAFRRLITGKNKLLQFLISFTFVIHAVGILLLGSIGFTLLGVCVRTYDPKIFVEEGQSLTAFIVLTVVLGSLGVLSIGMMLLAVWSLTYFFKTYQVK